MVLAPTFMAQEDRIGRISCMEPGIGENGTVYAHTNAWMIFGLLQAGQTEKAYEVFRQICPGYFSGEADDPKKNCLPYMVSNSYFGSDHRNNKFQMEFTWITGSVAWLYNILLQHMLGIRSEFGGLRIDPKIPAEWPECQVERQFRGATYHITIRNPSGLSDGRAALTLDGRAVEGNLLPIDASGGSHEVVVTLLV
jgi:cellobiose phosphorylase